MAPGFVISFNKDVLSPSRICDLKLGFSSPEYNIQTHKHISHIIHFIYFSFSHNTLTVHCAVVVEERDLFKSVAKARVVVIRVVSRCDLDASRPERHVYKNIIENNRNLPPIERVQNESTVEGLLI